MASHDSGVETSSDSCCTNDNTNGNTANTSFSCSDKDIVDAFSVAFGSIESATSSAYFKSPDPTSRSTQHKVAKNWDSPKSSVHKSEKRYQHHHTTRNALVPYVCKLPNERKLRLAASVSNIELLVRLLDSGVNPNTADEHLRCPLHLAASRGMDNSTSCLIKYF